MSATAAQATAIITGSFLSGAMTCLSLIGVPVFLDTTTSAPQLFSQWARMYHYGHQILPTMAVGTFLLYNYTAFKRRNKTFALAGVTTLLMLPFTWVFMVPTNNELFRLEGVSKTAPEVKGMAEAKELVVRWAWLHLGRSLFPLVGALLGTFGGWAPISK
ncbi:protein of unknown function (DUF1772) domain containing protein [Rhypophila decipiens]